MFEAMRQAAFLYKLETRDPRAMPAQDGARAGDDRRRPRARPRRRDRLARARQARRRHRRVDDVGPADADVRSPLAPRLRHPRRRRADDDRQRQILMRDRKVLTLNAADVLSRGACLRRQGARRRGEIARCDERFCWIVEVIEARVRELAGEIERDHPGDEEVHLVCVLKGGFIFMADLVRPWGRASRWTSSPCRATRKGTKSSGEVRMLKDLDSGLEGRNVVIVEDIVDTGLTLTYLQDILRARSPKSLQTACLLSKPSRRQVDVQGGLHRLHDRGPVRRGLRAGLRGAVSKPRRHRRAGRSES